MLDLVRSNTGENKFLRRVFGFIAFLIVPIALFSSKAMTPLFIILAVLLLTARISQKNFHFNVPKSSLLAFFLLLLWAGLSQLWTFDSASSTKLLFPLLALFALGLFTLEETKSLSLSTGQKISRYLIAGIALAIALLFFESVTGNWLTRLARGMAWHDVISYSTGGINIEAFIKNGVVILSVLIWPTLFALWNQKQKVWPKIWAAVFFIATLYLIYRFSASTALIAFGASIIGIGIAIASRKIASLLIAGVFVVFILAMPFSINQMLGDKTVDEIGQIAYDLKVPNSAINRLIIWQFASKRILEKPITGWGMNTARQIPGGNDKYTLRVKNSAGEEFTLFREFYVPLHTHNQALQIWLELGAIGAFLIAGFGWLFIRKLGKETTDPALFGVIISLLAFSLLSFGAWQSWWIATQFLCITLAIAVNKREN